MSVAAELGRHRGPEDPQAAAMARMAELECHVWDAVEISLLPQPQPLIEGLIFRPSMAMMYGPPKHGKSFVALDMALSIASDVPYAGHTTTPTQVLYVVGEGASGIGRRKDAWAAHHGVPSEQIQIHFLTRRVNLGDWTDTAAVAAIAIKRQAGLVIFDTLARCSVGLDENSSRDMGHVIESLDYIRENTGATVLLIHHTGKDRTRGARGSNALLGAVDTELEVTREGRRVTLRTTAQKDTEEAPAVAFDMVALGKSAVLNVIGAGEAETAPESVWHVLDVLAQIAPNGEEVASTAWLESCDVSRRTFFRARGWLVQSGRVDNVGTSAKPRYRVAPKDAE